MHKFVKDARILIEKQFEESIKKYGTDCIEFISGGPKKKSGGLELNKELETIKQQLTTLNEIQLLIEEKI